MPLTPKAFKAISCNSEIECLLSNFTSIKCSDSRNMLAKYEINTTSNISIFQSEF